MSSSRPHPRRRRAGPPLVPVLAVSVALYLASVIVSALMSGTPYPAWPGTNLPRYLASHRDALRFAAVLQFAASVPLVVFGASVSARLQRLRVRAAGPVIGLVGSVIASAGFAVSALAMWALSQSEPDGPLALYTALRDVSYAADGAWHLVGLGLLIAGIAVPALYFRLLPRWFSVTGVAIAVMCELSTLVLLVDQIAYLVPLDRLAGLVWLLTAAWLLPVSRPQEVRP